jgi:arsenate reductase
MKMIMMALAAWMVTSGQSITPDTTARVVFVCEHGAAKSLIAAAYFNKLAAERQIPVRASFRAVTPQDDLSVRAVAGLRADGVPIPDQKPKMIGADDINHATHIFAIGCQLPKAAASSGKAASWDDVPDDRGYPAMRDAIVVRIHALLDDIQKGKVLPARVLDAALSKSRSVRTAHGGWIKAEVDAGPASAECEPVWINTTQIIAIRNARCSA